MAVENVNISEAEEEDFKEYYAPVAKAMDEETIRRLSSSFRNRRFQSEQEARDWLFGTLEHWDKQSWSHIFGQEGPERNRWFADHFPVYEDRYGKFRLGRPLMTWADLKRKAAYERRKAAEAAAAKQHRADFERLYPGWTYNPKAKLWREQFPESVQEYLSNNTSDFSDGTNGEPTAMPVSPGDQGTNVGLPDYKYIERTHQQKKDRLRGLLARRDPGGVSKNPVDIQLRRSLGESEEDDLVKELGEPGVRLQKVETLNKYRDLYYVYLSNDYFVGSVERDGVSPRDSRVPSLQRIWTEFPWIAHPSHTTATSRHRTQEEAVGQLKRVYSKEAPEGYTPEYNNRFAVISAEEQRKLLAQYLDQGGDTGQVAESLLETADDDEGFKDVYPVVTKPFGYACRATEAYGKPFGEKWFARNTSKSTFTPYIGDARLYRNRSTWMRGWPDYFNRGLWEIVPVFHDPRKWGERALHADQPKPYFQKKPRVAEAMEDDDLVKDVSGPVNISLDEFVKRYDAVRNGMVGANTYFNYFWMPRELQRAIFVAEKEGIPTGYQSGHIWTLIEFKASSVLPGVISLSPAVLNDMEAFKVKGFVVTRRPGDMNHNVETIASDTKAQYGYI